MEVLQGIYQYLFDRNVSAQVYRPSRVDVLLGHIPGRSREISRSEGSVMGAPLIINEEALKGLVEHAEANKIPVGEMYRIAEGKAEVVGDREGFSCNLDVGYRVVFSIEEHPQKDGSTKWFRHMSMSQVREGRTPNIAAIGLVGEILGFPVKDGIPVREKVAVMMDGIAVGMVALYETEEKTGSYIAECQAINPVLAALREYLTGEGWSAEWMILSKQAINPWVLILDNQGRPHRNTRIEISVQEDCYLVTTLVNLSQLPCQRVPVADPCAFEHVTDILREIIY